MPRARLLAALSLVTVGAVVGGLAAPVAAAPRRSGPTERVTLVLAPQDRTALRSLAAHHGTANPAAVARALPSARARSSVQSTLRSLGFRVERVTPLTVDVSAPASVVRAWFGSARSVAARSRMAHPLPRVPAALRSAVTVAFGGDETRPAFSRAVTDPGPGLRAEYGVGTALPTTTPGATIATVQLSDWSAADLSHYAADLGGPAPKLTQINDSGYPAVLSPADSVEVDLDQEAIYSVAPNARQRLYKSDNQFGGMYSSLLHIADDALDGVDDNILAASISWGFCESSILYRDASPDEVALAAQLFNSFEDVLSYVASTGVTVFVASGDDGTSCIGPDRNGVTTTFPDDVSYPASSPQVIAVGGTSTLGSGRTSWDDPSGSGSGGGVSRVFKQPGWQVAAAGAQSGRVLPDLAALAGSPGFNVYSSTAGPAGYGTVLGTSLASPLSAASYATAMATAVAHPYGVGDILADLYANPSGFNDVAASGDDGLNPGSGPAAPAAAGFDRSTGLGTPKWDMLAGLLPGTPHLTPTTSTGAAKQYFNTTVIPFTVTKSMAAVGDPAVRYRVDDVTFTTPSCSIVGGAVGQGSGASYSSSYDVTNGDSSYVPGSGDYDGDYTLAVIETDSDAAHTCRVGLRNATVDTLAPTVGSPAIRPVGGSLKAVVGWSASDELSGVAGYTLVLKRFTSSGSFVSQTTVNTSARSYTFTPALGYGYIAYVQAKDRAGNVSSYRGSLRTTLYDDGNLGFSSGWASTSSSGDFGGGSHYTSSRGRYALRNGVVAKTYYVLARTGPAYGRATVRVGSTTRTVDLYSSTLRQRVLVFAYSGGAASRSVVITSLGTRNSRSHGNTVVIDGLFTFS
jgi:hypothetical protein